MKTKNNKTHIILLLFLFVFIKFLFAIATVDEIRYFIYPISKIIDTITNTHSVYVITKGYFNEDLNFVINKSCSGINFFLIFLVSISYRYSLEKNKPSSAKNLIISILLALIATLLANSSRILCSITAPTFFSFNLDLLHQIQGTVVYLFFLLFSYLLFDYLLKNKIAK